MKKEDKITLTYNLFDLPTAQHKAGPVFVKKDVASRSSNLSSHS